MGKQDLVAFMPESRLRELGGLYSKVALFPPCFRKFLLGVAWFQRSGAGHAEACHAALAATTHCHLASEPGLFCDEGDFSVLSALLGEGIRH